MNHQTQEKNIYTRKTMKNLFILLVILFISVVLFLVFYNIRWQNTRPYGYLSEIEYLEDTNNSISFEDVKNSNAALTWKASEELMKGNNTSTWWVKIKTDNILQYQTQENNLFLSISNPTVEKIVLYFPTLLNGKEVYKTYHAGWGFSQEKQRDEGFSYPVFKLPKNIPQNSYAYLKLSSSYTNNYTFRVMNDETFNRTWQTNNGIHSLFIGLIIAFGINNFIQFTSLKISAQIYYVTYLTSILIYQPTVFGMVKLYFKNYANLMIANVASLALMMMIAALMFLRSSLDTKKAFPLQHKISNVLILLCFVDITAMLIGYKYYGNIISVILANTIGILIITTSYYAVQRKITYAKYLFAGWSFTLYGSMIFNARSWGLIPNNEFTLYFVLIPIVGEAILLSLGLAELVRKLGSEKEDAIKLYQKSEAQVVIKEAAFLQAQIKPHFLFNALNVIEALCYIDAVKAGELILELSKFLQHSFDFRNLQKYVPLDEELEFIKAYVKIEQARFMDELKVDYDIEDTQNLMLPPLILQPLVENAIKHGIRKQGTSGTVSLRVKNLPEHYLIEVEDDGSGMSEKQIEEALNDNKTRLGGVGISNIQKRLKMFYNTELKFESKIGVGTKVTIILPMHKG